MVEEHLNLIERGLNEGKSKAYDEYTADVKRFSSDNENGSDEMLEEAAQNYEYRIAFLHPLIMRGPFLVTLFAVYESIVIDIAELLQKRLKQELELDDLKGKFLTRTRNYYRHVLRVELNANNQRWERLLMLADLRNAMAHANGRTSLIRDKKLQKMLKDPGVDDKFGYILVSADLAKDLLNMVKTEAYSLMDRSAV